MNSELFSVEILGESSVSAASIVTNDDDFSSAAFFTVAVESECVDSMLMFSSDEFFRSESLFRGKDSFKVSLKLFDAKLD